jgi:hypothetical protein
MFQRRNHTELRMLFEIALGVLKLINYYYKYNIKNEIYLHYFIINGIEI